MTGKVLDNSAKSALVLILPIAVTIVVLLKAWPILLALFLLVMTGRIWQSYQWRKLSQEVNPFFTELIKDNQGCLTPLDLSLKANLTAQAAHRFLEKKAEEYGAQKKVLGEKGVAYYFLTASALGSIFEDSEPSLTEDVSSETTLHQVTTTEKFSPASTQEIAQLVKPETPTEAASEISEKVAVTSISPEPSSTEEETSVTDIKEAVKEEKTEKQAIPPPETSGSHVALIQSDLAKRLDLNASTVGRRKSDPDFPQWSQSKDPEGIAWKYVRKSKMFVPIENE